MVISINKGKSMNDNVSKAWAAGLFDGEGSFSITIRNQLTNNLDIRMTAELCNTDKDGVLQFHDIVVNGSCHFRQRPANSHRKDFWHWQCNSLKAVEVAKLLLPYLVIKRERAELFIEFSDKWERHGKNNNFGELLAISEEMTVLNKRGR